MSKENKGKIVSNRDTVNDNWEARHNKFQDQEPKFEGHNPMLMTDFEKSLVEQEKMDRFKTRLHQTLGIQGVDGGRFPRGQC